MLQEFAAYHVLNVGAVNLLDIHQGVGPGRGLFCTVQQGLYLE